MGYTSFKQHRDLEEKTREDERKRVETARSVALNAEVQAAADKATSERTRTRLKPTK